jgi:hypothetical protein
MLKSLPLRWYALMISVRSKSKAAARGTRRRGARDRRRDRRPQLFRLTFERSTPDVISAPGVSKAAIHSYNTVTSWIRRVEIGSRSVHVVAFQLHALCQGLATSELQHKRRRSVPTSGQ